MNLGIANPCLPAPAGPETLTLKCQVEYLTPESFVSFYSDKNNMSVLAYLCDFLVQMIKIIHIATILTFTESGHFYVLY